MFTVDELDRFSVRLGVTQREHPQFFAGLPPQTGGRLVHVRRGLYATVPWCMDSASMTVDPYLVAAKMTKDAVLAYHTALGFHGRAYSAHWRLFYVSANKSLPLAFQSHEYRGVPVPPPPLGEG